MNKLNDFKHEVWKIIFDGLNQDPLKTHEKAVEKEEKQKTN